MSCFLVRNIKHGCDYNSGGISNLYLLNIKDFISYQFVDDNRFDSCLVKSLNVLSSDYIEIDTIDNTSFTENFENDVYKQSITTYIRSLDGLKTSNLLIYSSCRYIVFFRTYDNKYFLFGSDGGASISFNQSSGELRETSGYSITINKSSIYPLFQLESIDFNLIEPDVPDTPDEPDKPIDPELPDNPLYQKGKISSIYHEYSADPNGSGTWNTWLTTPRDWNTPPYDGANDNFGSNDPSNNTPWRLNGINKQTLQTVEIGEHVFTRQNFMFKYRYDKPQNYANVTQEEIDEAFATTPVQIAETYDQSRYHNGAYTLCDEVVYDAVNKGVFYNNRTDRVETDRFKIPTAGDYAQMLSMADNTTYQGILQFVAVKPAKTDTQGTIIENGGDEQLPYPYDHIWENTTDSWDLSGLHLVPSARRYNAGNGDQTGAFYAYRKSVGLRIANEDGTLSNNILAIYSNADSNTAGVALNNGSTYHLSSVRLCRRKTTQELGYQLYADTANDKIIVTSWDAPVPVVNDIKLEPIPIGRLRGICVRYLNADKTQVLASLSSLQAKVELTNTGKGRWSGFDNY